MIGNKRTLVKIAKSQKAVWTYVELGNVKALPDMEQCRIRETVNSCLSA